MITCFTKILQFFRKTNKQTKIFFSFYPLALQFADFRLHSENDGVVQDYRSAHYFYNYCPT